MKVFKERFPTREKAWENINKKFPDLKAITRVTATRTTNEKTTTETRYYMSSIEELKKVANAIRDHWAIENKLHRTLDVTFNEDHSQIRIGHAAENLGLIRRMAINMLKKEVSVKKSIRRKQMACIMDQTYLEKVLGVNAQTVNPI